MSQNQLSSGNERLYAPLHATCCTWVDTEKALQQMKACLSSAYEIAIDVEFHSHRSYCGFICLLQISTREEDFLVDALELRSYLHVLNDVFTDSQIAKVMHCADSDVLWLQRDFGLYLVGMFDTGQAMRILDFQSLLLSHLLKHYCGVNVDKSLQQADWRIRPLTEDMATHARENTHFLLYIYDRLKADLATKDRCRAVWTRSAEICRRVYKTPQFDPEGHLVLLKRSNVNLSTPSQMAVLQALYAWRDDLARAEDESPEYVLPKHQLIRLASGMPQTPEQLHAVCHPLPPLLNYKASSLLSTIRAASTNTAASSTPAASAKSDDHPSISTGIQRQRVPEATHTSGPTTSSLGVLLHSHPMQASLQPRIEAPCAQSEVHPQSMGTTRGIRCPPAPSQSPPLPPERVYCMAGWIPSEADHLARSLLPSELEQGASLSEQGTTFMNWSSGSSVADDDCDEGDANATAKSVQQQMNASPLWVLKWFSEGETQDSKGSEPVGSAQGKKGAEAAAPRSLTDKLTEIYKLSNQNKRRGISARRPSDEVAAEVEDPRTAELMNDVPAASGADVADMASGSEDGEDAAGDHDAEVGVERDGSAAELGGQDAEEFMRRIGWLKPDAEMPTGCEPASESQRNGSCNVARRAPMDAQLEVGSFGPPPGADGREPPLLPFQRQLPPHMPKRTSSAAPAQRATCTGPISATRMPSAASGGALAQLLAAPRHKQLQQQRPQQPQQHSVMPPQQLIMPQAHASGSAPPVPGPQDSSQLESRKQARSRHKRRGGAGNGDSFDYDASTMSSQFVYSAMDMQASAVGPHRSGQGAKGSGNSSMNSGMGGGGKRQPSSSGNRSMSFAPPGTQGKGGGRRH